RALLHAAIPLRDEKDDKLFAYFIAILRDFIKILLYRHNEKEVIAHVGSMVDNIVHAAHTLTSKRSVAQNKQKTSVLEKLSRVLILYLYHQNKILQQKYHPKPQPA